MAKIKNAELEFWFSISADGSNYIDLGQCMSLVNRISARQQMQYVVKEVSWTSTDISNVIVSRLPNHWPCVNALEKSYHMWKKQQDDAADEAGLESTAARYRDFKIHFDSAHQEAGFGANLLPVGYVIASGASATELYEWEPSQFVIPNAGGPGVTAEFFGHVLGPDTGTSKGLIHAYAESRSRPQQVDPNFVDVTAEHTLFGSMFNVGEETSEIITNYQDHNHVAPYLIDRNSTVEFYPGGENQGLIPHYCAMLQTASGGNSLSRSFAGGFLAPAGLLRVDVDFASTGAGFFRVVLMPGDYKGSMARDMKVVN